MKKLRLFDQNHGLFHLQKCQFCLLFKSMCIFSRKACFLTRTSPTTFSGFILHKTKRSTIYDMGIQGFTRDYRRLQGVTRGYKGLQGVIGGYKGLQGVTGSDKGLQGVTMDNRNFFLTRTFPDTF